MHSLFYQTRARFLQASRKRFAGWGEANNHRQIGAALSEFHALFVVGSSYYERRRWIGRKKPIYYRQAQLGEGICDRMLGRTPYGKMFSKLSQCRRVILTDVPDSGEGDMARVIADTWDKLGPAPEIDYDKL
jgi:hypothetical protein